jgi:hypothetical protein
VLVSARESPLGETGSGAGIRHVFSSVLGRPRPRYLLFLEENRPVVYDLRFLGGQVGLALVGPERSVHVDFGRNFRRPFPAPGGVVFGEHEVNENIHDSFSLRLQSVRQEQCNVLLDNRPLH